MKDVRGMDIQKGDTVAYCTRRGSTMDLRVGEVVEALDDRVKVQPEDDAILESLGYSKPRVVVLKTPYYIVSLGQAYEAIVTEIGPLSPCLGEHLAGCL